MPFVNTQSITATDMNNMLRGLYRDNTSRSTSGTGEDDLASLSIGANTIGATGSIEFLAAGTVTGAADTKRIRAYFGGTLIYDSAAATGTSDWVVRGRISNTASGAQRILIEARSHNGTSGYNYVDYITTAIDTTASAILKVTGEATNAADTVTQTMFEVQVQQIS